MKTTFNGDDSSYYDSDEEYDTTTELIGDQHHTVRSRQLGQLYINPESRQRRKYTTSFLVNSADRNHLTESLFNFKIHLTCSTEVGCRVQREGIKNITSIQARSIILPRVSSSCSSSRPSLYHPFNSEVLYLEFDEFRSSFECSTPSLQNVYQAFSHDKNVYACNIFTPLTYPDSFDIPVVISGFQMRLLDDYTRRNNNPLLLHDLLIGKNDIVNHDVNHLDRNEIASIKLYKEKGTLRLEVHKEPIYLVTGSKVSLRQCKIDAFSEDFQLLNEEMQNKYIALQNYAFNSTHPPCFIVTQTAKIEHGSYYVDISLNLHEYLLPVMQLFNETEEFYQVPLSKGHDINTRPYLFNESLQYKVVFEIISEITSFSSSVI